MRWSKLVWLRWNGRRTRKPFAALWAKSVDAVGRGTAAVGNQSSSCSDASGSHHGSSVAREILLVPILRAGQGLVGLADQLLPEARLGYLGMVRNEATLQPECYLEKLPPRLRRYEVMICDPMLATGGSAVAAGQLLQQRGAERLHFLHALAAPEGVRALRKAFPNEPVYLGAVDERLNEHGYIHPGLGDAGDRCFGA